ncbi:MAG: type II toxin-antitoxin system PemK/MazF family toxin [Runella sp.]
MATFVKGDIVVLPFPFSDLSASKRRPALVLVDLEGDDIILCQITSKNTKDSYAITLDNSDLVNGFLSQISNVRPNRLFTADKKIIAYTLGRIAHNKFKQVADAINEMIQP